jgi:hypothetical protein
MRRRLCAVRILHTAGGADEEGHRFSARAFAGRLATMACFAAFWACFAARPSSTSDEFMSRIDALQNSLTHYGNDTI